MSFSTRKMLELSLSSVVYSSLLLNNLNTLVSSLGFVFHQSAICRFLFFIIITIIAISDVVLFHYIRYCLDPNPSNVDLFLIQPILIVFINSDTFSIISLWMVPVIPRRYILDNEGSDDVIHIDIFHLFVNFDNLFLFFQPFVFILSKLFLPSRSVVLSSQTNHVFECLYSFSLLSVCISLLHSWLDL